MEFEFDPTKSAANKVKHGMDFLEAQALWLDADHVEIPAKTTDEPRTVVIGKIHGMHWSVVITPRGGKTRLISIRRSRKEGIEIYESEDI